MAATQGTTLDHLIVVAMSACSPRSHRTLAIGKMAPCRLLLPRYYPDSRLRYNPQSFSEESSFTCPGALVWGAHFRYGRHLMANGAALQECRLWMPPWCSPSALLQFSRISQKGAFTLIWSPDFVTVVQWTPPDHPALVTRFMFMVP